MPICSCELSHADSHLNTDFLVKILRDRWWLNRDESSDCAGDAAVTFEKVDRIMHEVPYEELFHKYITSNKPCLLGKWATANWLAGKEWVCQNSEDTLPSINFDTLKTKFGLSKVPVADCNNRYFNSQCKEEMIFGDFLSYWRNVIKSRSAQKLDSKCLYLKDWHFTKIFPEYQAYHVPAYFMSDWLNEFSDLKREDDFKFVYMGPKNSWTPFHADVYRSFSWSANVCGRKKWILFPPGQEEKIRNKNGEMPYDINDVIKENPSKCKFLEIIQDCGEIIFVPSGWYHQVHNIEDTISINHNWFNGANISQVVKFIIYQASLVRKEIADCKDIMTDEEWNQQCEVILKADSGMNLKDLVTFLKCIAEKRVSLALKCIKSFQINEKTYIMGRNIMRQLIQVIEHRISVLPSSWVSESQLSIDCTKDCYHDDNVCFYQTIFDLCMLLDVFCILRSNEGVIIDNDSMSAMEQTFSIVLKCLVSFTSTIAKLL